MNEVSGRLSFQNLLESKPVTRPFHLLVLASNEAHCRIQGILLVNVALPPILWHGLEQLWMYFKN